MFGSGIYSADITATFHCGACEADYELEGMTNDYGTVAHAECGVCGAELMLELSNTQNDDSAYDQWRESQLED